LSSSDGFQIQGHALLTNVNREPLTLNFEP